MRPAKSSPSSAPASAFAKAHRGLNRNLLVLGSAALFILGGLGFFLASRGGSIFNSEQKITNEIINNSYFQDLIASGATTRRDLESLALVRPFGTSFVGISQGDFTWEQAQAMARRVGAEVLSIGPSIDGSRQQLVDLLESSFADRLAAAVWVREGTEPRILDGPDALPVFSLERQRKVLLHWQKGPSQSKETAIAKWQNARFGMFIHWGPGSLTGEEISWSRGKEIPTEQYDQLYKRFNPTKFNADEWVAIAKAAGMKYMILTTKHHDGFCLWDTKQTDYNIMNSPFRRDVVKELSAACRKQGIAFGTYYSTCDWHHPDFPQTSPGGNVKRENYDLDRYTEYLKGQVKELLTNYGPLSTIWFDVPQKFDQKRGQGVIDFARSIQPDILINNRTGAKGDYDTPEQRIGGFQIDRPWETCMTICQQWAWKPDDPMKSLAECVHSLLRVVGGDGSLLFNVGPMPTGEIEPRQVERLREMGDWLNKNGEAVYGTRGGPWKPTPQMVSTRKGHKIYLHLLEKPSGPVAIPALPVAIKSARVLNGTGLVTKTQDSTLSFEIPGSSLDATATIVELTVEGDVMEIAPQ